MIGQANFKPEPSCIENLDYAPSQYLLKEDVAKFTTDNCIKNAETIIISGHPQVAAKHFL
jgi:hypothetical protein